MRNVLGRAALMGAAAVSALLASGCEAGGGNPAPSPPASSSAQPSSPPAAPPSQAGSSSGTASSTGERPVTRVFDQQAMQTSVRDILTDDYGIGDVRSVSCPSGQKVEAGATFTCLADIAGESRQVRITVQSEQGRYEVAYPE